MPRRIDARESLSRRKFIFLSGIIPAAMSFRSISTAFGASETAPGLDKKYPIGLELYSVRDQLARDLPATLREVARIGYTIVEFYAPYYNWTIPYCKDVRKLMDDLGLRCFSTHNHIESFMPGETMAHAIELNQLLGSKLLVLATAPDNTNGVEGWKNLCGELTSAVEQFALHGLAAGFHNHQ